MRFRVVFSLSLALWIVLAVSVSAPVISDAKKKMNIKYGLRFVFSFRNDKPQAIL